MTLMMDRPVVETPVTGSFRTWDHDRLTVVAAPREIDILNSPRLRDELALASRRGTVVVVDMRRTSICDSTALSVLAAAGEELSAAGGELRVVCGSPVTLRCMRATGDDKRFRIFGSLIEALSPRQRPDAAERRRFRNPAALRLARRRAKADR